MLLSPILDFISNYDSVSGLQARNFDCMVFALLALHKKKSIKELQRVFEETTSAGEQLLTNSNWPVIVSRLMESEGTM